MWIRAIFCVFFISFFVTSIHAQEVSGVPEFCNAQGKSPIVPNLIGLNELEARERAKSCGYGLSIAGFTGFPRPDDRIKPKQVGSQWPRGGVNSTNKSSRIDVYLNIGHVVPDLVGNTKTSATSLLKGLGFEPKVVSEQSSLPVDTVISQSISPGTIIEDSSRAVELLVSEGAWVKFRGVSTWLPFDRGKFVKWDGFAILASHFESFLKRHNIPYQREGKHENLVEIQKEMCDVYGLGVVVSSLNVDIKDKLHPKPYGKVIQFSTRRATLLKRESLSSGDCSCKPCEQAH